MSCSIPEIMQRLANEQAKFDSKKSKAGATRVRATLLELRKACDSARKSTLEDAKNIPVKPRMKKLVNLETLADAAADLESSDHDQMKDEEVPPVPVLMREVTAKSKRVRKPKVVVE